MADLESALAAAFAKAGYGSPKSLAAIAMGVVRAWVVDEAQVERAAREIAPWAYVGREDADDPLPIIATRGQWQESASERARAALAALVQEERR